MRGGLVDLEFIAQFATITHLVDFSVGRSTAEVLGHLPTTVIDNSTILELNHAYQLYTNLTQIMRLCLNDKLKLDDMPPGLADLLQRVAGEPDLQRVEGLLAENAQFVTKIFDRIIC